MQVLIPTLELVSDFFFFLIFKSYYDSDGFVYLLSHI